MAAKGIRVNQLAKELGVESKSILAKCRDEGLGGKVPNHMSVLSVGLAETVREWFSAGDLGGGGTAVETAAPVDVATKPRRAKVRKRDETTEDLLDGETTSEPAIAPEPPASALEPAAVAEVPLPAPVAPAPVEVPVEEQLPPLLAPEVVEAPPAPIAPPASVTLPPAAAASAPPTATSAVRPTTGPAFMPRETITLSGRGTGPAVVERKAVIQAPKLGALEPAKISGPSIVRVEKADNLPPLRRPMRPGGGGDAPAFTQARPQQGRGVKVSEEEDEESKKRLAGGGGGSGGGAKGAANRTLSNRRRGPDGRRGDALAKLKEFSEADLEERRTRLNAASSSRAAVDRHLTKTVGRGTHALAKTGVQRGEPIEIEEPISVKGLSSVLGIKSTDIVRKLFMQGVAGITINSNLDQDTASAIALEYGIELVVVQQPTLEEELLEEMNERAGGSENFVARPPVVTILGHVDHGKTSLLDRIRKANVAAGEAGGITQHTAAWMVQLGEGENAKRVTFIDTPGHQAFTSMRARGADMTDVVVLVVSAAEGVQPQTIESINHARAAEVPIVVAMNKIDRPDANEQQVLGQLAANGLNPVEWGGDTEVVRTSAVTGQGIEELIEILDYQAELLELKADPAAPSRGTVIESQMSPGLGAVATVLVQNGTLKVGDVLLCGPGYGRIRMLQNDLGESVQEAGPSTPVVVSGLDELPDAGDKYYVVENFERARTIAEERQTLQRQSALAGKNTVTLDTLFANLKADSIKTINLIIKADVQGSVETLQKTVTDANTEEVRVRVIHAAVGGISESDVELADASGAVIIGFHVVPDESARAMAEQRRVEIRLYRVIYEIFDDLKKALSGLLEPEIREKLHGHAEVRQIFKVSRVGNIAGCVVTDGHIQRGSRMRLSRGGVIVTEDVAIETLRRLKDDVKEVKSGLECGIKLAGYDDIKIGDIFEAYIRETIQRTL